MVSLNTFLTFRIHNVCPIDLSDLNLEECLDKLDQISYRDRELIQILSVLFINRNLKRKKIIFEDNIFLYYENGCSVKLNYNSLCRILALNLSFVDALAILKYII